MATLQFALSDSAEAGPDTWQFTVFLSFVSLCWFLCCFFFPSSSFFWFFFFVVSFFFFLPFLYFFFLYSSCLLILLYLCGSFLLLFPFNPCVTHTFNKPQHLPKTGHTKQLLSGRNFSILLFAWPLSTLHCQAQQKQAAQILGSLQFFYCLYRYAVCFFFFFFFFFFLLPLPLPLPLLLSSFFFLLLLYVYLFFLFFLSTNA